MTGTGMRWRAGARRMDKPATEQTCQGQETLQIFFFSLAVFTLEDEQIVWTDKSSQMDKLSDVETGWTNCLIFVHLERQFFPDDLPVEMNKSMTVRHKFTSEVKCQTICSSSSVKTAIVCLFHSWLCTAEPHIWGCQWTMKIWPY